MFLISPFFTTNTGKKSNSFFVDRIHGFWLSSKFIEWSTRLLFANIGIWCRRAVEYRKTGQPRNTLFQLSRIWGSRRRISLSVLLAIKYWLGAKIRDDDSRQTLSTFLPVIPTSTVKLHNCIPGKICINLSEVRKIIHQQFDSLLI